MLLTSEISLYFASICINNVKSSDSCKFNGGITNALGMQEFNAKLSDFGLAKAGPTGDRTHVSTQVMGTHGYAAPEYVATGLSNDHVKNFFYLPC